MKLNLNQFPIFYHFYISSNLEKQIENYRRLQKSTEDYRRLQKITEDYRRLWIKENDMIRPKLVLLVDLENYNTHLQT